MTERTKSSSSRKAANGRPPKPYPEFPLTPHPTGYWAKKIRGRLIYFGRWGRRVKGKVERLPGDGWEEALDLYKQQADDLHAGRTPRKTSDGLAVTELCNRFLTSKQRLVKTGELSPRTWQDYHTICGRVLKVFGKDRQVNDLAADDFEQLRSDFAKTHGPVALGNDVQRVRVLFKFAFDNSLIDRPIRYGSGFKKPSPKVLRKARAENGSRLFEASEIRAMLDAAGVQLRAMVWLGINCAFGNQDCATLSYRAIDLDGGWVTHSRPKTGIARRAKLWRETVQALREAIDDRPEPSDPDLQSLVFITSRGKSWAKDWADNPITKETVKLLRRLNLHRRGRAFYGLRHSFRTVADATRDFPAVRLVMGHADSSIDNHYREHIDDDRLEAVADHVRQWLICEEVQNDG